MKLVRRLILILFCMFGLLIWLTMLVVDDSPRVTMSAQQHIDEADSVKALIEQIKRTFRDRKSQQTLIITESQLNSLLGLVARARQGIFAGVRFDEGNAQMFGTYLLPETPFGNYINFEITVQPDNALKVKTVEVGGLTINGSFALWVVENAVNWWTNSELASDALTQVNRISIRDKMLFLSLKPMDTFLVKLNNIRHGLSVSQNEPLRYKTAHYLAFLHELPIDHTNPGNSLTAYMTPLFTEAKRLSENGDAVSENEAAILALAVYTGHHRLANFIGEIQPIPGVVVLPKYRPVLSGRHDLTRHFVISAALHVLSQKDTSYAIGEFKELMDRAQGGSGYSFVDMAADLAGLRFAEVALDQQGAVALQTALATSDDEAMFFPDIAGLPEHLNKQQFEQQFGHVDSASYKRQLNVISERINRLPLFANAEPSGRITGSIAD